MYLHKGGASFSQRRSFCKGLCLQRQCRADDHLATHTVQVARLFNINQVVLVYHYQLACLTCLQLALMHYMHVRRSLAQLSAQLELFKRGGAQTVLRPPVRAFACQLTEAQCKMILFWRCAWHCITAQHICAITNTLALLCCALPWFQAS